MKMRTAATKITTTARCSQRMSVLPMAVIVSSDSVRQPTSRSRDLLLQGAHLRSQAIAALVLGQAGARLNSRAPAIGIGGGVLIRSWLRPGCRRLALRRLGECIPALFFGQFGNLQRAVDADLAVAQVGTKLRCGPYCLGGEHDGLDIDAGLLSNLPLGRGNAGVRYRAAVLGVSERRRLRLVVGDLRWLEMPPLDHAHAVPSGARRKLLDEAKARPTWKLCEPNNAEYANSDSEQR